MARLFSRVEFARVARVSPAAITKAGKKQLANAFVGDRIDADHPDSLAYLASRGITQAQVARGATAPRKDRRRSAAAASRARTTKQEPPSKKRPAPTADSPPASDPATPRPPDPPPLPTAPGFEELDEIERKIQPLLLEFGSSTRVADWLDCVKTIQEIRTKKLANEQTQGKLIERELVRKVIFSALDSLALKLLRDAPPTLAREVYALSKSGSAIEAAESKIEGYIEQIFESVNDTCRGMLNDDAG